MTKVEIRHGNNLDLLKDYSSEIFDLIYMDPPFNTGKKQKRGDIFYEDNFKSFHKWINRRFKEAYRLLAPEGSFFLHIDYREAHYCKINLDKIFGRECFQNEIIWAYDYGGRSKSKWSAKHDTILWYSKNPKKYTYRYDDIDRIPYLAPGLVGIEKASKGKVPTDVWWNTIVPTQGKEKTGYPTQKPRAIIDRIIKTHSNSYDWILDPFAGSGTTGESAWINKRNVVLIDKNPAAIEIMKNRLALSKPEVYSGRI